MRAATNLVRLIRPDIEPVSATKLRPLVANASRPSAAYSPLGGNDRLRGISDRRIRWLDLSGKAMVARSHPAKIPMFLRAVAPGKTIPE
jgi:hypothetical protein